MSDIVPEIPLKNTNFSRRDFLKVGSKVAGAGLAAIALNRYVNREDEQKQEGDSKWRVLEGTDGGLYIPIYESHKVPWQSESFNDMPDVDVILYEVTRPSKDMANQTGEELLGKADEIFARDTWIPKDHSEHWGEKGTLVAFEGLAYPNESMVMKYTVGTLVEGLAGLYSIAGSFSETASKPLVIADKEIMTGEIKKTLMRAGGIWGSSAWLQMGIGAYMNMMTATGSEGMQNASLKTQRLGQLITQIHPEFDLIFLRNLIMARRLQSIQEKFPQSIRDTDRPSGNPTTIAFNVGAIHSGVEDWLVLGPEIVKFMIELSPEGIWKQMSEINGGPENMATMPLVLNNGLLGHKVMRIKDDWFQKTIERKVK